MFEVCPRVGVGVPGTLAMERSLAGDVISMVRALLRYDIRRASAPMLPHVVSRVVRLGID